MGIEAGLREEFDRWERRETAVVKVLPYLLLAVGAVVTLLQPLMGGTAVGLPAVLGLTLAAALWLVWPFALERRGFSGTLAGVYYAGLMVLAAGLVLAAPWYAIFAFTGYVHAFVFLPGRWRYLGGAATSMIMAVGYMGGVERIDAGEWWLWAAISLVSSVLSASFLYSAAIADRFGHRQKRALTELHEANVRLEAALEENASLHARLLEGAREAGARDERQRMAREIHDTLAQSLAGILTQLQSAEQTMNKPEVAHRHMAAAMGLARESLVEARRSVHAVEPAVLDGRRLTDAIDDVAARWSKANGVDAVMVTTGDPRPMHTDVEVALLRTAQEALANVAKHAEASRVQLTLSYMEDLVTLDVRDDGAGFEPGAERAGSEEGGFGLVGMRQRVQRLTGRLDVESEPGGGTAVSASVPAIPAGDRS